MGEANQRGDYDQRREEAVLAASDSIICLRLQDDGVHCATIIPNRSDDNPAVILSDYFNANLPELLQAAMAAHKRARTTVPSIVTDVTPRIIGADGPATSEVKLVGVDGGTLQ